MLILKYL